MPSWKKIITSGSNATLNSLYAPSITGSLLGTASFAISASYALTASYSNNLQISGSINNVDYIDFNTGSATPTWKSGRVFWDNTDGCLNVYNAEADITLQVGQENWTKVRNNTGTSIINGTVVKVIGAQGDVPTVERAQSVAKSGSINVDTQILGVATHTIEDNSIGYVTTQGLVRGLNTNAFNDGDTLFVGTGSSGILQNTPPVAPYEIIPVGICVKASPGGSGIIYVAVQQPLDFPDLSTVQKSGSYSHGDLWTYVPSGSFGVWTHTTQLSGSYGVTGSFSVLDSIDATNKILIGSGPIPGSTANSVDWGSRTLFDTNGNFSVRWGLLRSLYDTNASQSVDWNNRLLKFDNGPGDYTVNWSSGLLRDTGSNSSVDWQNRITIDTGTKTSIDWQNRQLKDSSGNETLNWQSGVKITGSLTVSGSSTFTNIGPARFSGSFVVQGDLIPGFPPFIPDVGPYDAIKVDDIAGQRILYGSPLQGASASIDFGNRTLFDNNASDTISWGGTGGEFSTFKYNAQQISATTRDNLYSNNRQGGQFLNDSYFDINVVDNDLVYLNTDGQWYQVDQTTNSSTKMLGIAKSVSSQTGSVLIEGDIVVTTGTGYPAVANAGYGLPVYIKQGAGTAMDTTAPVSGYVRLLGHCYYTPYAGSTEWIMKFRPSNEWVQL